MKPSPAFPSSSLVHHHILIPIDIGFITSADSSNVQIVLPPGLLTQCLYKQAVVPAIVCVVELSCQRPVCGTDSPRYWLLAHQAVHVEHNLQAAVMIMTVMKSYLL